MQGFGQRVGTDRLINGPYKISGRTLANICWLALAAGLLAFGFS